MTLNTSSQKPVLLCILDGWGHAPNESSNAITAATTPHWDALLRDAPHGLINASEHFVGLPKGQMGNSEVGHMNIGSGRPVRQLLPRINEAIAANTLKDNEALATFAQSLKDSGGACHLMGLCSDGGVHAHLDHMIELARIISAAGTRVWIHAITDGRDTPPHSARDHGYMQQLVELAASSPNIAIATIGGRYFAMDRDHKWDRVQPAYEAFTDGIGFQASDPLMALGLAYERDSRGDEFIQPIVLDDYEGMQPQDGILFANFRPDRARQIMAAFTEQNFDGFDRAHSPYKYVLGMADYWSEDCPLDIPAIFPMERVEQTLGALLSETDKKQLRIAETEKFNHVTFFFSGGNGKFSGEDRILVKSPDVATYDLQPEMSAPEVTDRLVDAITSGDYDFIVVNYANPDMVGHTGNRDAAIKAVEAVDSCLGRIRDAIHRQGGILLVTADHGNVDVMRDTNGQPHTQHTTNLVPFIVDGATSDITAIRDGGRLADIAPTILSLMSMSQPDAMSGQSLLVRQTSAQHPEAS